MRTTLVALALAVTACASDVVDPICVPGASQACSSGPFGAQICADGAVLGACVCDGVDGGPEVGESGARADARVRETRGFGDGPTTARRAPVGEDTSREHAYTAARTLDATRAMDVEGAPAAEAGRLAARLIAEPVAETRAVSATPSPARSAEGPLPGARPMAEIAEGWPFVFRSLARFRGRTPVMCFDSFADGERIHNQPRRGLIEVAGRCSQAFSGLAVRATCYIHGDGFSITESYYRAAAVASDAERLRCVERKGSWWVHPPSDPPDPNARVELPLYDTGFGVRPGFVFDF